MASGGVKASARIPKNSPQYLLDARKDLGIKEWIKEDGRKVSNPVVLSMFHDYGHSWVKSSISTPWCAAYINYRLESNGYPSTRKLNARSYLYYGDDSSNNPQPGDIVVAWRGRRDDGVTGHVYFFIKEDDDFIWGLGGNQGDEVSIEKHPKSKVLAIRRPRKITGSKTARSAAGSGATGVAAESVRQVDKIVNPAPTVADKIDAAKDSVDQITQPLSGIYDYLPTIAIILTMISVSLALLALYYRYKDFKESGL